MFELLQKNMEPSPAARLSPPSLSPPPGLLPDSPSASTPTSFCAVVKTEPEETPRCESPEKRHSRGSPFTPLEPAGTIKAENDLDDGEVRQDASSSDQMLKERLEMYWKGIVKYQQQLELQKSVQAPELVQSPQANVRVKEEAIRGDVLEKARNVVQRLIEDDNRVKPKEMPWPSLAAIAASRQLRSPKNGQSNHISNMSPKHQNQNNFQQASFLSQQALATMLSLHSMQKQPKGNLGDLLPPPPALLRLGSGQAASPPQPATSPLEQPHVNDITHQHPVTSFQSVVSPLNLSHDMEIVTRTKHTPTSLSNGVKEGSFALPFDAPLDLSMPVSGRKRIRDSSPKVVPKLPQPNGKIGRQPPPLLCVGQGNSKINDPQSLANIQSNFPSILNKSDSRATQQALLEAHIKNSLANKPASSTNGPFTSLYQNQDVNGNLLQNALAAAGGKTLNELVQGGVPPIQIQQWLLAAISAQKAQQMALNQFTLIHQSSQNVEPPKKRAKMNNQVGQHLQSLSSQQPLHSLIRQHPKNGLFPQTPTSTSVNSFTKSQSNHPTISDKSPKSNTSPNLSPDSAQSQSGKRYRRYAKPPYSYVSLITLSILSSRDKKLRLSQILKRISEMFPFFNGSYQGWRDSVRHNLSQNECFVKVLKNPYRPTAKGNFWTVNLSSIPHELLLRQNTLVSRYAQDSGYRYRKDLSEVFDLRTGALKVPVPRHLFRDACDIQTATLSEDPAAVMEAILLEETGEDEMNDYKDKIPPEIRRFTLEDLFTQSDDVEDESLIGGGKGRRAKQVNHASATHAAVMPPSYVTSLYHSKNPFFASHQSPTMVDNFHASLHSRALEAQQNLAMRMLPQPILATKGSRSDQQCHNAEVTLPSTSVPNPFAAAQTALLSKALATQLQGLSTFPAFQKMFYANQMAAKQRFDVPAYTKVSAGSKTPSPPPADAQTISPVRSRNTSSPVGQSEECIQMIMTDPLSSLKKNKRKGVQPVRRAGSQEVDSICHTDDSVASASPQRSSFSAPAAGDLSSRTVSSEVESVTVTGNPFSSPVMSSTKSHSSISPPHDDSTEYDGDFGIGARNPTALSEFQRIQLFGVHSLQAGKMM